MATGTVSADQAQQPAAKLETSVFRFILRNSVRGQLLLLALTAVSLPFVYISLEVPKMIINRAIGGKDVPTAVLGYPVDQVSYLLLLCFAFLGLVILNGGLKYVLNVYKGVLGERLLRRFRYQLYYQVLRFPLKHFKRTSPGEIIPMIVAETEPMGEFIGDAFALPAFQGGILLTYLFFIFNQDLFLGAAAISLYPLQMYVIPKLQRRVNQYSKQRVRTARKVSDRIGETVTGITEIHANDTSRFERADLGHRLGNIYAIRFEIYKRKFFIKFLNNFLAQVTPFFFYAVGGYFVIQGQLSLGALVAVLAAYKDLASPWRELLKYYQTKEDIRVKFEQVIEQFEPADMLEPRLLDAEPEVDGPLVGEITANNVSYTEDESVKALDGVSFQFPSTEHVAVLGPSGSGKDELGRVLARLVVPTAGRIRIAEHNLATLPDSVVGRRIGYAGQNAFIFAGTIGDNLFYGLKHRPQRAPQYGGEDAKRRQREYVFAVQAGNSTDDVHADWLDYAAAGVQDRAGLIGRAIETLSLVELDRDVYQFGLLGTADPAAQPELIERLLEARAELRHRLQAPEYAPLVELFDRERFNTNMTVAENLLFGTPRDPSFDMENLAANPYVRKVLHETGLMDDFLDEARRLAEIMLDLFADVPLESELFEQFGFIRPDDLPTYRNILSRTRSGSYATMDPADRIMLLSLLFRLIPARHRLGLFGDDLQRRLLEARAAFERGLEDSAPAVEFFHPERYNPTVSIQDNILFGKLAYGQARAQTLIGDLIRETVDALGLRERIMHVGLDYEVGTAGGRLALAQRQKLAIARALLKNTDVLILNEATGALDAFTETRVLENLTEHLQGRGLICVLDRAELAHRFDRVLVMSEGRVAEQGTFAELDQSGEVFRELRHSA